MKHAKSNINLLKKTHGRRSNKNNTNIFNKYIGNQNYIKNNNIIGKRNFLLSFYNNEPNKFNLNTKKIKNKEINLTTGIERINIEDGHKKSSHHGNINIRLNLISEIINNNFNNYYSSSIKQKKIYRSLSNISLNERLKEKDKYITKLQKELLQSQELLNVLQKNKQNELSLEYQTIKNNDSTNKIKNLSLRSLLNIPSSLKYNNNNKDRGNINHIFNLFNTRFYSKNKNNNKKQKFTSSSPKSNNIRFFSSSPHRFSYHNLNNLEIYNPNFSIKHSLYQKANKNIKYNKSSNSNSNIFMKQNYKYSFPDELGFTKQVNNSNFNIIKKNNNNNNNNSSNNNYEFIEKCQKLKKKAKLLLNNYISLIKEQSSKKNNKNI